MASISSLDTFKPFDMTLDPVAHLSFDEEVAATEPSPLALVSNCCFRQFEGMSAVRNSTHLSP